MKHFNREELRVALAELSQVRREIAQYFASRAMEAKLLAMAAKKTWPHSELTTTWLHSCLYVLSERGQVPISPPFTDSESSLIKSTINDEELLAIGTSLCGMMIQDVVRASSVESK